MSLKIWISANQHKAFIHDMKTLLEPTKVQSGCLSCHMYEGMEKNAPILLIEEWESEEQLQKHLHSEEFNALLSMMEQSESQPVFKIDSISESRGIDGIT